MFFQKHFDFLCDFFFSKFSLKFGIRPSAGGCPLNRDERELDAIIDRLGDPEGSSSAVRAEWGIFLKKLEIQKVCDPFSPKSVDDGVQFPFIAMEDCRENSVAQNENLIRNSCV